MGESASPVRKACLGLCGDAPEPWWNVFELASSFESPAAIARDEDTKRPRTPAYRAQGSRRLNRDST